MPRPGALASCYQAPFPPFVFRAPSTTHRSRASQETYLTGRTFLYGLGHAVSRLLGHCSRRLTAGSWQRINAPYARLIIWLFWAKTVLPVEHLFVDSHFEALRRLFVGHLHGRRSRAAPSKQTQLAIPVKTLELCHTRRIRRTRDRRKNRARQSAKIRRRNRVRKSPQKPPQKS